MISLSKVAVLASVFAYAESAKKVSIPNTFPSLAGCISETSFFSCENTTAIQNTCCSPTPGGLVLQTQFWSTYTGLEKQGQKLPKDSWTIHGLWPDNCDGSFESYCDLKRQFDPTPAPATLPGGVVVPAYTGPGVDTFIKDFGRKDLLDFMNKYWINQGAPNADFWAHEVGIHLSPNGLLLIERTPEIQFSKHATCTSTFDVACYGSEYREHQDVIDFFDAVVRAFHQYPTFDILAAAGIVPSNTTTYTLDQFQNAIKSQTGSVPYFGCRLNGTVLSEVWYFSHVHGTEQFGTFKTVDSVTPSSCSTVAPIRYLERTPSSEHEVRE